MPKCLRTRCIRRLIKLNISRHINENRDANAWLVPCRSFTSITSFRSIARQITSNARKHYPHNPRSLRSAPGPPPKCKLWSQRRSFETRAHIIIIRINKQIKGFKNHLTCLNKKLLIKMKIRKIKFKKVHPN